jgi:hypothetical protein
VGSGDAWCLGWESHVLGMSVKMGHERGCESVESGRKTMSREKLGLWAMGWKNREWDVENFSNDCMGGSGYI